MIFLTFFMLYCTQKTENNHFRKNKEACRKIIRLVSGGEGEDWMEDRPYTGFYARLLGGFSLDYEGNPISINANPQCRYMQILLILLKAGKEGISRKSLLEMSQTEDKDSERQTNNFRQQVFALRKTLAASGLPEGRYIVSKRSRYYFSLEHECHTDTEALDGIVTRLRTENLKEEQLYGLRLAYCKNYTGEFLPMLNGEEWATAESAYYQKWYSDCLQELSAVLRQEGRYEQLLELVEKASQIHPYDEWQTVQIECLMALNRHKEAMKVYEEASDILVNELGLDSMEEMLGRYQDKESQSYYMASALSGVKKRLQEEEGSKEPYQCSYPSFLDLYHIIARIGERAEIKNILLICTLRKQKGGEGADSREDKDGGLEQQMESFRQCLVKGVRFGDAYTRYSENQYLALLIGADEQGGKLVADRLLQQWESGIERLEAELVVYELESPRKQT